MAFCANCGTKLEDDAKFCAGCGAPVNAGGGFGPAPVNPRKPVNGKLIGILCGAGAALILVIALVVVLVVGGGYSSPEAVAEAAVKARYDGDSGAYLDCYPEFAMEALADDLNCDVDELEEELEDVLEQRDSYGFGCSIIGSYIVEDGDDLDELPNYVLKEMSSSDKRDFEGWAEVKVEYEESDGDERTETVNCICLDGKWYIIG